MQLGDKLSIALVLAIQAAASAATTRDGITQFTPPPAWHRQVTNGQVMYTLADRGILSVQPSEVCSSLDNNLDKFINRLSPQPGFRMEAKRNHGPHIPSGGQWASFAYSTADPNRPGQYVYGLVTLVAAGGRSVAIVAVFAEADSFNAHIKEIAHMIDTLQITSGVILERGNPPLTRFDVDATLEFIEWLMQVPLTDGQKQFVETQMHNSWQRNDRSDIDEVQKIIQARDQFAMLPPEQREFARQKVLDDALAKWRSDPAPDAKMMLEIYDCSHTPIANGVPPLTKQSCDALVETLCFAAEQMAGVTCTPPSADMKARLAQQVATNYPMMSHNQQQQISEMPLKWAALRVSWPDYSDQERHQLIEAWQHDQAIAQLASAMKDGSVNNPPVSGGVGASNQQASVAQSAQSRQQTYQALSNGMRMQYNSTINLMSSMNNMSGSRYEYRFR